MPNTCFIIQPFDDGEYDKRCSDIYEPALERAGFEAYRVDQDPSVSVLIDAIEEGISKATICLADISADNPNVWYELGFAVAAAKPIILICSDKRNRRFPFDIQHRSIITYRSDSISDFEKLKQQISEKAEAFLSPSLLLAQAEMASEVLPATGLSHQELIVIGLLAGETAILESTVSFHSLKHDAERAGLTPIGFGLAIRRLVSNKFVSKITETDADDYEYLAVQLTGMGWKWIEDNKKNFALTRSKAPPPMDLDDEIPF